MSQLWALVLLHLWSIRPVVATGVETVVVCGGIDAECVGGETVTSSISVWKSVDIAVTISKAVDGEGTKRGEAGILGRGS